jgi:hypothetical protein
MLTGEALDWTPAGGCPHMCVADADDDILMSYPAMRS